MPRRLAHRVEDARLFHAGRFEIAVRLLDDGGLGVVLAVEGGRRCGCVKADRKLLDIGLDRFGGVFGDVGVGGEYDGDGVAYICLLYTSRCV